MKLTVLSTAVATALALIGASNAEAGPYGGSGGGGGHGGGYSGSGYVRGYDHYREPSHCAPVQVYKINTVEVNRYTQCRTAYDHCGRPYTVHVTVVTYCDRYSNGTTRTWSQTFS